MVSVALHKVLKSLEQALFALYLCTKVEYTAAARQNESTGVVYATDSLPSLKNLQHSL